jgi:hypothetical protein
MGNEVLRLGYICQNNMTGLMKKMGLLQQRTLQQGEAGVGEVLLSLPLLAIEKSSLVMNKFLFKKKLSCCILLMSTLLLL